MAEVLEQEEVKKPPMHFIGGEVRIIANPKDGSMQVSSPPNLLIALGMLETAKAILIQQHHEQMAKEEEKTRIQPATVADLAALKPH